MFVITMNEPSLNFEGFMLLVSHLSLISISLYEAVLLRISSLLVKWGAIPVVQSVIEKLGHLDAKIHRRPASLDQHVLQNMLYVVESLPRFQTMREFPAEVQGDSRAVYSRSQKTSGRGTQISSRLLSLPVKGAMKLANGVLRSLDRRRNHQVSILRDALNRLESILEFVADLKSTGKPRTQTQI